MIDHVKKNCAMHLIHNSFVEKAMNKIEIEILSIRIKHTKEKNVELIKLN